jgi:hypothetical protein
MRIAHFDCFNGISGDMTLAALIGAGVDEAAIRVGLDSLGLPIKLHVEPTKRCGFAALAVRIEAEDQESHRYLKDVEEIIDRGRLTDRQKDLARRIFRRLADAEAAAHGMEVNDVHFHEVGALDSIADIVGAAIGLDLLGVDRFTSRSVPTGQGTVRAAHGVMPIPTPGTVELLRGVPLAPSPLKAELTTPTGAAILTTVVQEWVEQPAMRIERVGHGAGQRDFAEHANILRLFVGTATDLAAGPAAAPEAEEVWVVETNLDDVPAEVIGYCYELLFAAGALDVYTQAIHMKKNRPGVLLTALAPAAAVEAVEEVLFRETATFGVRRYPARRHKLERRPHTVHTRWGPVEGKLGWRGGSPPVFTPEYEACARIAREHRVPLREVYEEVRRGYQGEGA